MKQFTKNNQSFECEICNENVQPHPTSSRDHCNHCLYGKHVDINPGDRMNNCRAILKPIGLDIRNSKQRIVYRCSKCSNIVYCISAPDDSKREILELSSKIWSDV